MDGSASVASQITRTRQNILKYFRDENLSKPSDSKEVLNFEPQPVLVHLPPQTHVDENEALSQELHDAFFQGRPKFEARIGLAGLFASKVSGQGLNCFINTLLQHATLQYGISSFDAALIKQIKKKAGLNDKSVMRYCDDKEAKQILKAVNAYFKVNLEAHFIQIDLDGGSIFGNNLSDEENITSPAEPVVIWQQPAHYVGIASRALEGLRLLGESTSPTFARTDSRVALEQIDDYKDGFPSVGKDESLSKLIEELSKRNQHNPHFLRHLSSLEETVRQCHKCFELSSCMLNSAGKRISSTSAPIKDWDAQEIQHWATSFKLSRRKATDGDMLPEVLAIIMQAVVLQYDLKPRDTQLLSVVSLLQSDSNSGRLAQIFTGEGKSMTIAILALLLALDGKIIDIVTSNEVLARRDAADKNSLYILFGFGSQDCCDNSRAAPKSCYADNIIVYGDTLNFEADILCDEYRKYGTRQKRPFDIVIVDEVDSMLIDDRLRMTLLSTPTPGMSALTPVLNCIWNVVAKIADVVTDSDPSGDALDPEVLVKLHLKDDLAKLKAFAEDQTPEYLKAYALANLFTWCTNATKALMLMEVNQHYVVRDDKIVPVDYRSTGVLQRNSHWSDGLHQFLQMKHNLCVTQINLTTNFLSNVSFFRRYKHICGLTGTLGSQPEQTLLADLYLLDCIHVPPFRERKLTEVPGILVSGKTKWTEAVTDNVLARARHRAVLVICETIQSVQLLEAALLTRNHDPHKISCYTEGTETVIEELRPGQIILATNLAGRGTDLRLSKDVKESGGLYVCVTFLPDNLRVQEQAFGRAGRQGDLGTCQMIVDVYNTPYAGFENLASVKLARDKREQASLAEGKQQTTEMVNKDALFKDFCDLLQEVNIKTQNDKTIAQALEERWALWLLTLSEEDLTTEKHKSMFREFREIISEDLKEGTIIRNPKYYMKRGNEFLNSQLYEKAFAEYEKSSELNKTDWQPVYLSVIAKIKHLESSDWKFDPKVGNQLLEDLERAMKLCAERLSLWQAAKTANEVQKQAKSGHEKAKKSNIQLSTSHSAHQKSNAPKHHRINPKSAKAKDVGCGNFDDDIVTHEQMLESMTVLQGNFKDALQKQKLVNVNVKQITSVLAANQTMSTFKDEFFTHMMVPKDDDDDPFPWAWLACTGILAILELGAGLILCMTGVGVIWGKGLLVEGATDVLTTFYTWKTGEFDWKAYALQKSAGLALTAIGAGGIPSLQGPVQEGIKAGATALRVLLAASRKTTRKQRDQDVIDIVEHNMHDWYENFGNNADVVQVERKEFDVSAQATLQSLLKGTELTLKYQHLAHIVTIEELQSFCDSAVEHCTSLLEAAFDKFECDAALPTTGASHRAKEFFLQHHIFEEFFQHIVEQVPDCCTKPKLVLSLAWREAERRRTSILLRLEEHKVFSAKDIGSMLQTLKQSHDELKKAEKTEENEDRKKKIAEARKNLSDLQTEQKDYEKLNDLLIDIEEENFSDITDTIAHLDKFFLPQSIFEAEAAVTDELSEAFGDLVLAQEDLAPVLQDVFSGLLSGHAKYQENCSAITTYTAEKFLGFARSAFKRYLEEISAAGARDNAQPVMEACEQSIEKQYSEMTDALGQRVEVGDDKDSFFKSVAVAIGLNANRHAVIRLLAVNYITDHKTEFQELMPNLRIQSFAAEYAQSGTWGGRRNQNEILILGTASVLELSIVLHSSESGGVRVINSSKCEAQIHLEIVDYHFVAFVSQEDFTAVRARVP